jgi:nuclear transport factor 2 (NTF2) superfamily protein
VNTHEAARRWAEVWEAGWRAHDVEAIAALYAPDCVYRSHPFRPPNRGRTGAVAYVSKAFSTEQDPYPHFTVVAVEGERAAVEWWYAALDQGRPVTLAGGSMVRFDADGLVVQEHDYWNQVDAAEQPFGGWGWGG